MRALTITGWILVFVAAAGCAGIYQNLLKTQAERDVARQELEASQAKLKEMDALVAKLQSNEDESAKLEAERKAQAEKLESMEQEVAALKEEVQPVVEEAGEPIEDSEAELTEQQQKMLSAQMGALSGMIYGEFFSGLDPAVAEIIRAEVEASMGKGFMLDQQAFGQNPPWTGKELGARKSAVRAELRASLAAQLTPEQLASWDEYDAAATEVLYGQVVGSQLTMLAPGLGEESRGLVQRTLGEALAANIEGLEATDEPYTMERFIDAQRTALQESAERLGESLTEEEFAEYQRYMDQAEQTFAAMAAQN
ncbi:MAG: hypothetical protein HYV27_19180 [Candidatus Hydrogenedentes bacterium]|nr:hypothetical protein [Candidatus Hydrogenedentota bacterium]